MPSARRHNIMPLFAIVASTLLIGASPQSAFDILGAVPQGAAMVVTVGNPAVLIDNAAGFLRNAGLESQADSLGTAMDSLSKGLQDDSAGDDGATVAAGIDLTRRLLVAIYPGDGDKFQTLVFLPLKPALAAAEQTRVGDALMNLARRTFSDATVGSGFQGYVALGFGGMRAPTFGAAETIDLSILSAYPAHSIAAWADTRIGSAYLDRVPGFRDILSGTSTSPDIDAGDQPDTVNPNDNTQPDMSAEADSQDSTTNDAAALGTLGASAIAEGMAAAVTELTGIDMALTVQKDRAWFRVGASLADGGTLATMAAKAARGDRSLPYLSYCDSDALMSFAWSTPQDWSAPFMEALYSLIMPGSDLVKTSLESMRAYAAAAGMNGGASVDVGLSDELIRTLTSGSSIDEQETLALVSRGLTLDAAGAVELKDRQAFRDVSANMMAVVKDPAYASVLAASGFSLDIERTIGMLDGLPFDLYRYRFGDAPYAALLERLVAPVYVYRDDKAYIGLGAPEKLRPLLARGAAQKPLQRDQSFMSLRAGAPADTKAIWYVSTKALNRLIMRLKPADSAPMAYDARALVGILGWFDATPATLGIGIGIGAEDIKAVVELLKQGE
ncbi:MAG TPA: hypothetical protein VMX33_14470 [bacterium]|nr:hypothetical protein [bacterium]